MHNRVFPFIVLSFVSWILATQAYARSSVPLPPGMDVVQNGQVNILLHNDLIQSLNRYMVRSRSLQDKSTSLRNSLRTSLSTRVKLKSFPASMGYFSVMLTGTAQTARNDVKPMILDLAKSGPGTVFLIGSGTKETAKAIAEWGLPNLKNSRYIYLNKDSDTFLKDFTILLSLAGHYNLAKRSQSPNFPRDIRVEPMNLTSLNMYSVYLEAVLATRFAYKKQPRSIDTKWLKEKLLNASELGTLVLAPRAAQELYLTTIQMMYNAYYLDIDGFDAEQLRFSLTLLNTLSKVLHELSLPWDKGLTIDRTASSRRLNMSARLRKLINADLERYSALINEYEYYSLLRDQSFVLSKLILLSRLPLGKDASAYSRDRYLVGQLDLTSSKEQLSKELGRRLLDTEQAAVRTVLNRLQYNENTAKTYTQDLQVQKAMQWALELLQTSPRLLESSDIEMAIAACKAYLSDTRVSTNTAGLPSTSKQLIEAISKSMSSEATLGDGFSPMNALMQSIANQSSDQTQIDALTKKLRDIFKNYTIQYIEALEVNS